MPIQTREFGGVEESHLIDALEIEPIFYSLDLSRNEVGDMNIKTLKTAFGYLATMLRKAGVIKFESESVETIYNYVPISKTLSTSGQPSKMELQKIRDAGFAAVINLAPHNAENSLKNEATIVADLGLRYIHIPVDFRNPTAQDFGKFVDAMSELTGSNVWVHCAANMRVSAFVYRFRCEVLEEDRDIASSDLHKIWNPTGVWKTFVETNRCGSRISQVITDSEE